MKQIKTTISQLSNYAALIGLSGFIQDYGTLLDWKIENIICKDSKNVVPLSIKVTVLTS